MSEETNAADAADAGSDTTVQSAVGEPRPGRYPHTALALIGALLGTLALIAVLVALVVRPDAQPLRESTDWHEAAAELAAVHPQTLDPLLPEGWTANYARTGVTTDGEATWEVGLLSPADGYVALEQIFAGHDPAVMRVADRASTAEVRIGERTWYVFDHRDADDPGNYAYALVTTVDDTTVVLHGTGTDEEFQVVAEAIAEAAG